MIMPVLFNQALGIIVCFIVRGSNNSSDSKIAARSTLSIWCSKRHGAPKDHPKSPLSSRYITADLFIEHKKR